MAAYLDSARRCALVIHWPTGARLLAAVPGDGRLCRVAGRARNSLLSRLGHAIRYPPTFASGSGAAARLELERTVCATRQCRLDAERKNRFRGRIRFWEVDAGLELHRRWDLCPDRRLPPPRRRRGMLDRHPQLSWGAPMAESGGGHVG